MNNFYFDDYTSISSDGYEGEAVLIDGDEEHSLLFFHDTCRLPFDIALRKHYYVRVGGEIYPVQYRFIVHTSRFDEENAYEGKLGCHYNEAYTEFYVWAPTAYGMSVCMVEGQRHAMHYTGQGVYYVRVEGNLEGQGYLLEVEHTQKVTCLDPYATSSAINSSYNYVINPNKVDSIIEKKTTSKKDAIVYEINVRDFTSDTSAPFTFPGKFKSFTQRGVVDADGNKVGYDYLLDLGVTHVQLLPIYDYGSIDESDASRAYNWGYDPVQYNVIEGKYSCDPMDPYTRINEVVELVNTCKKDGLGVIMDVVYNHVYDKDQFSMEKLVPHYFFRYTHGKVSNASYCGNEVASERFMVRRFMKDSLLYLTRTFGFAGYRFDLMGIHDIQTMQEIHDALVQVNEEIIVYGEGWSMPTAIVHTLCAIQMNHDKTPNIGYFNDDFRNKCKQLIAGHMHSNIETEVRRLLCASDYSSPLQSVQYVSCHDDYTLYDQLFYGFESDFIEEKVRLAYVFILLSQGFTFMHAGCEAMRTKLGVKNSFNSSEVINQMRYRELYAHKNTIAFVKELIRVRKLLSDYYFESKEEVERYVSVKEQDGIISYTIKDICIYINFYQRELCISSSGCLLSIDGSKKEETVDGSIAFTTYAIVRKEDMYENVGK